MYDKEFSIEVTDPRVISRSALRRLYGERPVGRAIDQGFIYMTIHLTRRRLLPPSRVLNLRGLEEFVRRSIEALGGSGFWVVLPLTEDLRKSETGIVQQESTKRIGPSAIGFFDPNEAREHLEYRRELITYEEWSVGSCSERLRSHLERAGGSGEERSYWDAAVLLNTKLDELNCISMCWGEIGEFEMLVRLFPGVDEALEELYEQLGVDGLTT